MTIDRLLTRLLPTVTTVTAATLILFGAGAATPRSAAAQTLTITGSYAVSQSNATGNEPTIQPSSQTFSVPLTVGVATAPTVFLAVTPAGRSGTCMWHSCNSANDTASDTVTVSFTDLSDGAGVATGFSSTATYTANYDGTLACSTSGGSKTDCFDWIGAGTSPTGSVTDTIAFSDGAVLDLTLGNAQDWTIYPTISADLVAGPNAPGNPVPGPATIAVFGSDVLGLGLLRKVRRTG